MRKLLGVLLLTAVSGAMQAATLNVATGGVDAGNCQPGPCATIQYAVDQATAGDTIIVAAGTYDESVEVDKTLTLLGAQANVDARTRAGAETIVSHSGGESSFNVTANNVIINGFTISGNTSDTTFGGGILISNTTTGTQILNNIIENNINGIMLGGDQVLISQNLIQNNNQPSAAAGGNGIYSDQSVAGGTLTGIDIFDNAFIGNDSVGINILPTDLAAVVTDLQIERNVFSDNGNAVLLSNLASSGIRDNVATAQDFSTFVISTPGTDIEIEGNIVLDGGTGGGGSGIRGGDFAGLGGVFANLTIHHNSLTSLADHAINVDAIPGQTTIDAENNWYGCNEGPGQPGCETVLGPLDTDPWLVLTISASPNSIPVGGTSAVTASLRTNSASQDTTAEGDIRDDVLQVLFSPVLGTVSPNPDDLDASIAQTTFTATTVGSGSVSATLHSETVTAPITIVPGAGVTGTKSVSGTFAPGGSITYTVVLNNAGPGPQGDNPGNEFVDVLPAGVTLVSASSTSGTTLATIGTNTVTFNGSIAAGGSVTITINATVNGSEQTVSNQGTINYDSNGDGTNDASRVTDNPTTPAADDPTVFALAAIAAIPTAGTWALMAMFALLAITALKTMRF